MCTSDIPVTSQAFSFRVEILPTSLDLSSLNLNLSMLLAFLVLQLAYYRTSQPLLSQKPFPLTNSLSYVYLYIGLVYLSGEL